VIDDPAACARQAVTIATDGRIQPDTICVHGDRPGATGRAAAVREALVGAGFELGPVG
jgi:5-oxoprolinase (ATP-hydrolysing) subunit A